MLVHFKPVGIQEFIKRSEEWAERGKAVRHNHPGRHNNPGKHNHPGRNNNPGKHNHPGRQEKPAMLLSFDDGLTECHGIIAPLLKKKGIPAIFFLNNDFIDNKGLFYRYKASLLTEQVLNDPPTLSRAAAFLRISEPQVLPLLMAVSYDQQILLDRLARELDYSFSDYLKDRPVYMTSPQIRELIDWGFEIGAHSMDHPQMERFEPEEVIRQVLSSAMDLQDRFRFRIRGFAFPFSSAGIQEEAIGKIIQEGITLFGISGIRETGEGHFIHRIDMEKFRLPALDTLRIKYLRYIFRKMAGRGQEQP
jgi:peptidoglycan/xylan/chitin deacetylase (PgdA/CDA1 family)